MKFNTDSHGFQIMDPNDFGCKATVMLTFVVVSYWMHTLLSASNNLVIPSLDQVKIKFLVHD